MSNKIQKLSSDTWTVLNSASLTSASTTVTFSAADNDEDIVVTLINGLSAANIYLSAGNYDINNGSNTSAAATASTTVSITLVDGTKYRRDNSGVGEYVVSAAVAGQGTANLYAYQKSLGVS